MDYAHFLPFLLALKAFLTRCIAQQNLAGGTSHIYCLEEEFKARCGNNQVILIKEALFGRMQLNRCVKVDSGYLGCHTDVRETMDKLCSGRKTCEVMVLARVFNVDDPCLELKRYLQVAYTCVSVMPPTHEQCSLSLDSWPKYLANSQVSHRSSCGAAATPWKIKVGPFRTLNITLLDFAHPGDTRGICVDYARIREGRGTGGEHAVTVCGGGGRYLAVYSSVGKSVQIVLKAPDEIGEIHYMLRFEVGGCPDLPITSVMTYQRTGSHVDVNCKMSPQRWRMTCREDIWAGKMQNCSRVILPLGPMSGYFSILPKNVLITMVVAITVVVAAAMIVIGLVCWKRLREGPEELTQKPSPSMRHPHMELPDPADGDSDTSSMYDKIPGENSVRAEAPGDVCKVYYKKENVYRVTDNYPHPGSVKSYHDDPGSSHSKQYM